MALNHVSMWTDKGFQPTTPYQAAQIHPYGASSKSGLFVCRLCGQYVSFIQNSYYTYFFKHSRGDEDKSCPERSFGSSGSASISIKQYSLPIQLTVNSAMNYTLAIGIVLPVGISTSGGVIQIEAQGFQKPFIFRTDNMTKDNISYFSIGQDIAEHYYLTVQNKSSAVLEGMIPSVIEGIPSEGCLFRVAANTRTGKKIPQGANVQISTEYYLLTMEDIVLSDSMRHSIICNRISVCRVQYRQWYVYRVKAIKFDENAAEFFLKYRCILTESAVSLIPLWPLYRNSPYITYHHGYQMWFYLNGQDVSAQTYPNASIWDSWHSSNSERLLVVSCSSRQQTLLAGKSKVLRYTYLWIDQLKTQATAPTVLVSDIAGDIINEGVSHKIPLKGIIRIQASFDGKVILRKNGQIVEKRMLKADQSIEIDQLRNEITIQVMQGLDSVYSISFQKKEGEMSSADDTVYYELCLCHGKKIPISHRYGALLSNLSGMPKSKRWITHRIRSGYIPEDALQLIKQIIKEKRCSHDEL